MIIAIDPGPVQSAFVTWDGRSIASKGIVENDKMLRELWHFDQPLDAVVIEMIASYGMPVGREVFETCIWIGRFIEAASAPHELVYRKDVKLHVCNSLRAKDSNIRQALIDRFGKPGRKANPGLTYGLKRDLWAAFAVAVTWWDNAHLDHSPL